MQVNADLTTTMQDTYELTMVADDARFTGHARHSGVTMRLAARLSTYAEAYKLGAVYGPDVCYLSGPHRLTPDISFIAADRLPPEGEPDGPWRLAPDLAVEIVTASDSGDEIQCRMSSYFLAGTRQVWIVLLDSRNVHIYRSATDFVVLTDLDNLFNLEILPGFRCRVNDLFELPAFSQVQ